MTYPKNTKSPQKLQGVKALQAKSREARAFAEFAKLTSNEQLAAIEGSRIYGIICDLNPWIVPIEPDIFLRDKVFLDILGACLSNVDFPKSGLLQ